MLPIAPAISARLSRAATRIDRARPDCARSRTLASASTSSSIAPVDVVAILTPWYSVSAVNNPRRLVHRAGTAVHIRCRCVTIVSMSEDAAREWKVTTTHTGPAITGPGDLPVQWRSDYGLPRSWRTTLEAEHLPFIVELDFLASAEGGPSCRAVRMTARDDDTPISARRLREVPVAECIRIAITHAAIPITRHADGRVEFRMWDTGPLPERFELARDIRPRTANTSDEHLREVAETYMAASEKPTQAVEEAFGPISHSTAARWVGEARRRGFLLPARQQTKEER